MIRLLVLFFAGLLAAPAPAAAQVATPAATPAVLRLVEQRAVRIEAGQPLSLAPDGRRLAAWREAGAGLEVCAYDAATLAAQHCAPFPGEAVGPDSVAWSPDGMRFAFTEDANWRGDEPDLWVFDAAAGTLANLTDDGVGGGVLAAPPGTPLDFAPAWSPDGTELVFARTVEMGEDAATTALYRIPAAGGEPREVLMVAPDRLVVHAGVRWLADGTILYSVEWPAADAANGLWAVAADGGEPRQLVVAADVGLSDPVLVDVSARGHALLLTREETNIFSLVDLTTGQVEPVPSPDPAVALPSAAGFSPDGTRLLVAGGRRLAVRDLATGQVRDVGELEQFVVTQDYRGGLAWAANDLAFGPSIQRSGLLLRLAAG